MNYPTPPATIDPRDSLDETVWYYYDIEGNVVRIVRKYAAEGRFRSVRMVYNPQGLVRYVVGEEWSLDPLTWQRPSASATTEYALTEDSYTWSGGQGYAASRGGDLANLEPAFEWLRESYEPDGGYEVQGYWVGAIQIPPGGEPDEDWVWVDTCGEFWNDCDAVTPYYTWRDGEPDDGGGQDHDYGELLYVESDPLGSDGLADYDGDLEQPCIVQRPIAAACDPEVDEVIDYARTFAWEFRYDAPRARYLRRELDPSDPDLETVIADEWSHYDGDEYYADFAWSAGDDPDWVPTRSYLSGVAHADVDGSSWTDKTYYHGDQIGSARALSGTGSPPSVTRSYVYTAFGELVSTSGTTDTRYRYAGAWGYESHADFPFLHVGWRFYDPETGRFLQHDPIGIRGGLNVYLYVMSNPLLWVDPNGLLTLLQKVVWKLTGGTDGNILGRYLDRHTQEEIERHAKIIGISGAALGCGSLGLLYAGVTGPTLWGGAKAAEEGAKWYYRYGYKPSSTGPGSVPWKQGGYHW